jgi:hypothetical protein
MIDDDMPTTTPQLRELAHRSTGGIEVRLLWDETSDSCIVSVVDPSAPEAFEIRVGDRSPMDVFNHPFASLADDWAA